MGIPDILKFVEQKAPTAVARGAAQSPEHHEILQTAGTVILSFFPGNNTGEEVYNAVTGSHTERAAVGEYFHNGGIVREITGTLGFVANKLGAATLAKRTTLIRAAASGATGFVAGAVALAGEVLLDPITNQSTLNAADVENTVNSIPTSRQLHDPELQKFAEQHPELKSLSQAEDRFRAEASQMKEAIQSGAPTGNNSVWEADGARREQLAQLSPKVRAELRRLVRPESIDSAEAKQSTAPPTATAPATHDEPPQPHDAASNAATATPPEQSAPPPRPETPAAAAAPATSPPVATPTATASIPSGPSGRGGPYRREIVCGDLMAGVRKEGIAAGESPEEANRDALQAAREGKLPPCIADRKQAALTAAAFSP